MSFKASVRLKREEENKWILSWYFIVRHSVDERNAQQYILPYTHGSHKKLPKAVRPHFGNPDKKVSQGEKLQEDVKFLQVSL